ncbi:HEAT repeat domain-containing protein, partial [Singulisphaera rosea]
VKPLIRVLGEDEAEFRMLLDHVLGVIPGPEAAAGLVNRILAEPDSEVRHTTLTELERRQEANVVPGLVRALQSTSPEIINRAAWALSNLGAVSAAPKLIPALLTTRYEVVLVPSSSGPGNGLGSLDPSQRSGVPIYTNGSSLGLLTGPVVGPGVVAYGATQVPWVNSGFSLSAGGASPSSPRGPEAKVATYTFRNVEVLSALVRLTGQDFGYDIATWKRWAATSFHPDRTPVRKVPQP